MTARGVGRVWFRYNDKLPCPDLPFYLKVGIGGVGLNPEQKQQEGDGDEIEIT